MDNRENFDLRTMIIVGFIVAITVAWFSYAEDSQAGMCTAMGGTDACGVDTGSDRES